MVGRDAEMIMESFFKVFFFKKIKGRIWGSLRDEKSESEGEKKFQLHGKNFQIIFPGICLEIFF